MHLQQSRSQVLWAPYRQRQGTGPPRQDSSPQPRTVHHIRQFLGLAGYYRRFIKNFSQIAVSNLGEGATARQKNRFIAWNTTCQMAFDRLKAALTSALVLHQVDPQRPFVIETDVSDFAIGSCLLQTAGDGNPTQRRANAVSCPREGTPPSSKRCLGASVH